MITGYYMTKEFVQSNMSNLLEDIRRNCISINLGVVDTMWVCDVMNNEKMGSLIAFAYESPQYDTPVDALYDAYTWLIKNGKIEQKLAWSEEDKHIINGIINDLEDILGTANGIDKNTHGYSIEKLKEQIDWLKSLKDRVSPQNFAVTDEELAQAKKDAYNDALNKIEYYSGEPTFDDGWSAAIWYLRKRNIILQKQWKPSEEQLEALESATENCAYSEYQDCLRELIGQLKKL